MIDEPEDVHANESQDRKDPIWWKVTLWIIGPIALFFIGCIGWVNRKALLGVIGGAASTGAERWAVAIQIGAMAAIMLGLAALAATWLFLPWYLQVLYMLQLF